MNYIKAFNDLKQVLTTHKDIEVEVFKINEPVDIHTITYVENEFELKLSYDIKEFYQQLNGCEIAWRYTDETLQFSIGGEIKILPILKIFEGIGMDEEWENELWNEEMEMSLKDRMQKIKPFDVFENDDSGYACLDFYESEKNHDHLLIFSISNGVIKLPYDFKSYIEKLLSYKGMYKWQYMTQNEKKIYLHDQQLAHLKEYHQMIFSEELKF